MEDKVVKVEEMEEWSLADLGELCKGTEDVPFGNKKFIIKKLSVNDWSDVPSELIFRSLVSPKLKKVEDTARIPVDAMPVLLKAISKLNNMNPEQAEGNSPALL